MGKLIKKTVLFLTFLLVTRCCICERSYFFLTLKPKLPPEGHADPGPASQIGDFLRRSKFAFSGLLGMKQIKCFVLLPVYSA